MSTPRPPAAVVYIERADGRVLAIPRKGEDAKPDYADWHLPGGKWEERDGMAIDVSPSPAPSSDRGRSYSGIVWDGTFGHDLQATAIREVIEETGLHLERPSLHHVCDYTSGSGRGVRLFFVSGPSWLPDHFPLYPGGVPAWVPVGMLTLPWCRLRFEAANVIKAVAEYTP